MIKSHQPSPGRSALRVGVAISALGLGLAACSSGGAPAPHSTVTEGPLTGHATGATIHGTIYISSQVSAKHPTTWHETKAFTETIKTVRNCAAFAKSGMAGGIFQVPSPQAPLPQDNIEVAGFRGPGTYPPQVLKHDKSDSIMVDESSGTTSGRYLITASAHGVTPGKEVLFVNPNGSGQLVYSEAHLDGKAGGPAIAGLISWSCTS
jgi:hypothetical protein